MEKISKKQIELLKQVYIYRQKHSCSPSFRELVHFTQISDVKSVYRIVEKLEKAGFVDKEKNKSRSIKLTDRGIEIIGLSSFPITFIPTPSSLDQLRQPLEFSRDDVAISSHSQEFMEYSDKSLETNGTDANNDLQAMIKAEVSLAMNKYFNGTSSQNHNPKQTAIKSVNSMLNHLSQKEEFVDIFGWGLLLILLTWASIKIIGNNLTALTYSIIIALAIKKFLK